MLKPIKNEDQYESALERIYALMQLDLELDSPEADELEVLSILVKDYEEKHHPIGPPDPIEAIKFRIEQSGFDQRQLARLLGDKELIAVSEVISGKKPLSVELMQLLHHKLGVPASSLLAMPKRLDL